MLKKISAAVTALALVLALYVPAAAAAGGDTSLSAAVVTADALNFRSSPELCSNIIGSAEKGEVILVLAEEDGWCRVYYGEEYGWMSGKYLEYLPEADHEFGSGRITGSYVRLRSAPSTDSDVLTYFFVGDAVSIIGVAGEWYKVVSGEKTGYVYSSYVRLTVDAGESGGSGEIRDRLVSTVKSCLGYGYVWGGQSPETGFDCSGLVCYTYSSCGFSLPRTATAMYNDADKIDRSELLPGDLVFFACGSGWYISHVGIYIGDGVFIHASTGSARVRTNDLSEGYFSERFYGAARVKGL
ncbi:MAG: C40 family peptidase [Oscillospiraceae bacterium]|nr:C40 family peptidase [Oscillospiraceae bacterium]